MTMPTGQQFGSDMFDDLKARWQWRPLPNCPGRFILADGPTTLKPAELLTADVPVTEHVVAAARDPVAIAAFADGGLISYRKPDRTYLHTLNSREGFERKLRQLGIDVP
jgi:hypothetical protein